MNKDWSDEYMIKLIGVTKVYKTGVRALSDINLTIEPGSDRFWRSHADAENLSTSLVQPGQANPPLLNCFIAKRWLPLVRYL